MVRNLWQSLSWLVGQGAQACWGMLHPTRRQSSSRCFSLMDHTFDHLLGRRIYVQTMSRLCQALRRREDQPDFMSCRAYLSLPKS